MSSNSARQIISVSKIKWKNLVVSRYSCVSYPSSPCHRCSHFKALNEDRANEKTFCDFTIATGRRRFPVHKCVIGVASEFFKKAITAEMKEKYEKFVTVNNVSPDIMEVVLNHIYGENISITNKNIDDLFAASDYLGIFTLNSACVEYISKTEINARNYLAVWIFSKENNLKNLLRRCTSFVKQNFLQIFQQELFLNIPISHIISFLELRDTKFSAKSTFELIIKWVEHDKKNRKDQFPNLFKLVDLDNMNRSYVANTVSENELVLNNLECLQKVTKIIRATAQAASSIADEIALVENHEDKLTIKTYQYNDVMFCKKEEFFVESKSCNDQDSRLIFAKGELYDIGGHDPGSLNSFTDVDYLDFGTRIWDKKASMLHKRSRFGCALMGNSIYVAGGKAHKTEILDSVECYSIRDNFWTCESSMHYRRAGCCVVACNDYLYVLGGDTRVHYGSSCSSAEVLDGDEWFMIEPMSESRSDFAAVALNDEIYAIAGYSPGATNNISKTVEVYKINEETWEFTGSLNHSRKGHSACVVRGKIYVAGGTDRIGDVAPVEVYNPHAAADGWKVLGNVSNSEHVAVFNFNSV